MHYLKCFLLGYLLRSSQKFEQLVRIGPPTDPCKLNLDPFEKYDFNFETRLFHSPSRCPFIKQGLLVHDFGE